MSGPTFLTDAEFRKLASEGCPIVTPFNESFVRPASLDLRLGCIEYKYKFEEYSLGQEISESDYEKSHFENLELTPGSAAFVGIEEEIRIPTDCIGFIFARSSITRLGLIIQPTYMNPGYSGRMPLTIINNTAFRVRLVPRVRVAQLLCARLNFPPVLSYAESDGSKYVGENVSASKLHTDAEIRAAIDAVLRKLVPTHLLENV